jgi:CubicO group peptidase (beta-lactamase class C family)
VDVITNRVLAPTSAQPKNLDGFAGYFDTQIPTYLRQQNIAGAVVAVVQDGQHVLLKGYGYADIERNVPMDPESTIVHIGSAGKTFSAVAVMQLVDQGLLDLDTDVNTYLDIEIPATYPQPITIRHLLTHTSGFEARDLGVIVTDAGALQPTRDYLIRRLPTRVRPPGETIGYSNYGLALLGYVVERVTGDTLGDYLESSIIRPLGMTRSSAQNLVPEDSKRYLAVGYSAKQPQPTEFMAAFGAAPVRSTAADMAKYMTTNLQLGQYGTTEILEADTARAMQARQFSADPRLNGTGFGFYELSRNGQRIVGHLGSTNFFHSILMLFPERQLGVFASFNSAEAVQLMPTGVFLRDFVRHFFPQTQEPLTPPIDVAGRAEDYAGVYFWNNRHGLTNIEKVLFLTEAVAISAPNDNTLNLTLFGTQRPFIAAGPETFRRSDDEDTLVLHRDEKGQVESASLNSRAVFTLERRPWYEAPPLTFVTLIGTGIVFLMSVIISVAGLWLSRDAHNLSTLATLGQWSALLMPALNLAFVAGLLTLLPTIGQGSLETPLRIVLLLVMLAAALALVLGFVISARSGIRHRYCLGSGSVAAARPRALHYADGGRNSVRPCAQHLELVGLASVTGSAGCIDGPQAFADPQYRARGSALAFGAAPEKTGSPKNARIRNHADSA